MKIITILILFISISTISYDLVIGEKNIYSLNSNETYYFFINAVQYQTININLTMNYMSTKPFIFSYIYELSNRSSSNYLKLKDEPNSMLVKNNQLILSFTYLVNQSDTHYIALQLTPNYNINYTVIYINVEGGAYDLSNRVAENITDLKSGIPYYFFLPSTQFDTNLIYLTMDSISIKPFKYLYIYENINRTSSNYLESTKVPFLTSDKNNNELTSLYDYLIHNCETHYIVLQFIPNYNINFIIVKINVEGGLNSLSFTNDKNITDLKSGIPYFFFIKSYQYETIIINLISNYNSTEPFTYSYIYEYNNRLFSNYLKSYLRNSIQSLTTIKKNNQITSSLSYLVDNSKSTYIIF